MAPACGTVLIVDDDEGVRTLIATLLGRAGYRTVEAATGPEALQVARRELPPLVLLDLDLPGLSGYEVCHELKQEFGREVAVVLVSGKRRESLDRVKGLLIGADDYLVKPFKTDELLACTRRLVAEVASTDPPGDHELTRRELQILRLLAGGADQTAIATTLSISPKTVSSHIEHLLGKLGVRSRAEAVAEAYRIGLVLNRPPAISAA